MKKYILLMFVFVAVLTSCTNDDITISYATNFKINPATVITPFTFEMNPGELESFGSDHRLRVRLLTYNSEGLLVQENVEYFTNYATLMSCSQNLPDGNYIAIAITDVGRRLGRAAGSWCGNAAQPALRWAPSARTASRFGRPALHPA